MIAQIRFYSMAIAVLFVFFLVFYFFGIKNQLQQVKDENRLVVAALNQAETDLATIRTQYLQIQEVVTDVAKQKQQLEKRTAALQQALVQSQRQTPCSTAIVPDDVTKRLRERAQEVNAAATGTGNTVSTLPGT